MAVISQEQIREHQGERLDQFLAVFFGRSRSQVQGWIRQGLVRSVSTGEELASSHRLKRDDSLEVEVPEEKIADALPEAEAIPLQVVFEDESLLVINKQPGLVVHPAVGHFSGTLVNALVHHCRGALAGRGGISRLGIVHRLDKDTSGLMVIAKTDVAHEKLSIQFQDRTVRKFYWALAWGVFRRPAGECEGAIGRHPHHRQKMAVLKEGGRESHTSYRVLKQWERAALVECELHTGRTHQIRVHLAHLGHAILGDQLYSRARHWPGIEIPQRQMLHSARLAFCHPKTGKEVEFSAPVPEDFEAMMKQLDKV